MFYQKVIVIKILIILTISLFTAYGDYGCGLSGNTCSYECFYYCVTAGYGSGGCRGSKCLCSWNVINETAMAQSQQHNSPVDNGNTRYPPINNGNTMPNRFGTQQNGQLSTRNVPQNSNSNTNGINNNDNNNPFGQQSQQSQQQQPYVDQPFSGNQFGGGKAYLANGFNGNSTLVKPKKYFKK
ncbi:putative uncharacterized protein DDB_G0277255 [Oppia nitens]|uniref:putative uncharacterized protein DDB_G0277255 n=1 Tax=Oppia nitens TaxID=1686743 RepID=UPI0023DBCFE8|nr:putative uncharacterized protein DDB_G0277255 [Oppia nitens]